MILLDIIMPKKDGFDVLDYMSFNRYSNDIPVIMISANDSDSIEMEGLKHGAVDFITKPFKANVVKQRVRNGIELFRYKRSLERIIKEQTDKLTGITDFVIDVLISVWQKKDSSARNAIYRVRSYVKEILSFIYQYSDEKYDLTPQKISLISTASVLHDIGNCWCQANRRPARAVVRRGEGGAGAAHQRGCEIIESIQNVENREYIEMALEICKYHHERGDGSGYPEHLVGDEIPISAQVVGLADTYDALRQGTVTGRRYTHPEAIDSIVRGDFGAFSPILTESCKMMQDKLKEIYAESKLQKESTNAV
jgi:putative two-component system response regulator